MCDVSSEAQGVMKSVMAWHKQFRESVKGFSRGDTAGMVAELISALMEHQNVTAHVVDVLRIIC